MGKRPYIGFYNSNKVEVQAESLYAAKNLAVQLLKPKKSEQHMVHVVLADVVHTAVD